MNYEKNDYFKILKTWCDTLIKLQMKEPQSPAIYGGIFCPACGRIHGRINDCMYPLIYLYKKTGDKNITKRQRTCIAGQNTTPTDREASF